MSRPQLSSCFPASGFSSSSSYPPLSSSFSSPSSPHSFSPLSPPHRSGVFLHRQQLSRHGTPDVTPISLGVGELRYGLRPLDCLGRCSAWLGLCHSVVSRGGPGNIPCGLSLLLSRVHMVLSAAPPSQACVTRLSPLGGCTIDWHRFKICSLKYVPYMFLKIPFVHL